MVAGLVAIVTLCPTLKELRNELPEIRELASSTPGFVMGYELAELENDEIGGITPC